MFPGAPTNLKGTPCLVDWKLRRLLKSCRWVGFGSYSGADIQ